MAIDRQGTALSLLRICIGVFFLFEGIGKIGWHTFRHTFSSLLHQAGTSLAAQKELLRHADIQTTMNIYTQAVSADKREAVQQVVKTLMNA